MLDRAKHRMDWQRYQERQKRQLEEKQEKERGMEGVWPLEGRGVVTRRRGRGHWKAGVWPLAGGGVTAIMRKVPNGYLKLGLQ